MAIPGSDTDTPLGGGSSVAAAGNASTLTIVAPAPRSVAASSIRPGYHFVTPSSPTRWGLALAAEGSGPAIVVSLHGCDEQDVIAMPSSHADWQISALMHDTESGLIVLACSTNSCALFETAGTGSSAELRLVSGSETAHTGWNGLGLAITDSGGETTTIPCIISATERMCFVATAWSAPTATPAPVREHQFEPPVCEDLELVLYAHNEGATADGRLVQVDNSSDATRRCTVVSEPLGRPITFFDYTCGIAHNLWLVTSEQVFFGANCDCPID